jgi:hypothetical protein
MSLCIGCGACSHDVQVFHVVCMLVFRLGGSGWEGKVPSCRALLVDFRNVFVRMLLFLVLFQGRSVHSLNSPAATSHCAVHFCSEQCHLLPSAVPYP